MKRVLLLFVVIVMATLAKADILGPYLDVDEVPEGYGRVYYVMNKRV